MSETVLVSQTVYLNLDRHAEESRRADSLELIAYSQRNGKLAESVSANPK